MCPIYRTSQQSTWQLISTILVYSCWLRTGVVWNGNFNSAHHYDRGSPHKSTAVIVCLSACKVLMSSVKTSIVPHKGSTPIRVLPRKSSTPIRTHWPRVAVTLSRSVGASTLFDCQSAEWAFSSTALWPLSLYEHSVFTSILSYSCLLCRLVGAIGV